MGGEELELVTEAFASNYIAPVGPMVDGFERDFSAYTGIKHCAAVSSGTAALHMVLRELGIGPGDEVFVSTLTFIGSISPVTFLGAQPVFIDSALESWNLDPLLLQQELERCARQGNLPKAVVPTDLYGQCVDMERILSICKQYEVPVVIDSAEAIGAYWFPDDRRKEQQKKHAGKGAFAAIYSFNGNKIITTSGGGMVASDDEKLIERVKFLATQARDPAPHYEHTTIGYNYRMSNILAAIGRGQLRVLDQRVARKREIFSTYQQELGGLAGISFMPEFESCYCTRWLSCILIEPEQFGADTEYVRLALEKENIESRPVWKPMHLQPVFSGCRSIGGAVSEELFEKGLCLPSGTAMSRDDQDRIIDVISRLRKNLG